ncbi:PEP-CTERM sorting domain-containing protein [Rugamonas sp.]|uniref:PEP-CTERM sorting domain-containing protein n=1 Tax=Rugamonas sp. TaxID=1926287 RepID=UPI0025E4B60A|nr:PEP-CTERM sorting domain-containing protein [Rugamonas sp.]
MRSKALAFALALACTGAAHAATIDWNTWQTTAAGTIGPVTVSYTGANDGLAGMYPSYTPATTFADGTIVANAPTSANGMIKLIGGDNTVNTITFSTAVINPVMAIWSLGQGGSTASFVFSNATPLFVSGGPSAEYNGSPITVSGNTVFGTEGNGTVQFLGTYTSLSWTNPQAENYYGFNVGIAGAVPEPEQYGMMAAGLALVGFMARRRKRA